MVYRRRVITRPRSRGAFERRGVGARRPKRPESPHDNAESSDKRRLFHAEFPGIDTVRPPREGGFRGEWTPSRPAPDLDSECSNAPTVWKYYRKTFVSTVCLPRPKHWSPKRKSQHRRRASDVNSEPSVCFVRTRFVFVVSSVGRPKATTKTRDSVRSEYVRNISFYCW